MAARKLQTEIDRTLKRVAEGVELFEEIHAKLMAANNATQKDKYETDLKSQIKKLQRLRDQIKTWLTSNDIKDKTQLLDNRRLIETQMERFKALEKEMKTKAFSKEGLQAATRLDPASKLKLDARHSLEEFVDSLSRQIEQSEAEIELLHAAAASGGKKKSRAAQAAAAAAGNGGGDKAGELERLNERRQWHVGKLEAVMRMLDNGRLSVDQVNDLKEDVAYFVESNQDEDFEEDEGIYDDLHLEEEEEAFATAQLIKEPSEDLDDILSVSEENGRTPQKEQVKGAQSKASLPSEDNGPSPSQPTSPVATKKTPARKPTLDNKAADKPSPAAPTRTTSGSIGITSQTPAQPARQTSANVTLPPIKYAAAAAAAVAQSTPPSASATQPANAVAATPSLSSTLPTPAPINPSAQHAAAPPIMSPPAAQAAPPADVHPSPAPSHPSTTGGAPIQPSPTPAREQPKQLSDALSPSSQQAGIHADSTSPRPPLLLPTVQEVTQQEQNDRSPQPQRETPSSASFAESSAQAQRAASRAADGPPQLPQHTPNALSDLMNQFETVKQKSGERLNDLDGLHSALETGLTTAPEPRDSERRPRYYHPRNPYQTPPYYPQQPHPMLDDKTIYSRMDLDTLFFIFYYRTNTYEQWCAARELKRQSWRFHKQYLTWFQRLSQPLAITEEYEQGMYIYFDWENTWCRRRKTDFRFEYRWLCED